MKTEARLNWTKIHGNFRSAYRFCWIEGGSETRNSKLVNRRGDG